MSSMTLKSSYFRFTNPEIVIPIPALKSPTFKKIKKKWDFIKRIETDDSLEGVVTLRLATVLKPSESIIDSEIYEYRIIALYRYQNIRPLGFQHWQWLMENQNNLPEPVQSALKAFLEKGYIDFHGISALDVDDYWLFLCMGQNNNRSDENLPWVNGNLNSCGRIAVVGPPTAKPLSEASI